MIEINNLTKNQIDIVFLKKVIQIIFFQEKIKEFELSIAFVSQSRIKSLNKKYRKKNKPTDVLSFNYGSLAEIIICPKEVNQNANKLKNSFKKELTKVLIHGILHLIGYNHDEVEIKNNNKSFSISSIKIQAQKMERKEDYYLGKFFS